MLQSTLKKQYMANGENGSPRRGINYLAAHPEEAGISNLDARIHELEGEWDLERTVQLNGAIMAFTGSVLGMLVDKRWFALPGLVAAFFIQHAVQGWSPAVPLFQKFGFRSRREIEKEKYALKALRGDFRRIGSDADKARRAAER